VSPAGAYYYRSPHDFAGQVADGGYFDNSGLLSLVEVIETLRGSVDDDTLARIHVIVITNDGSEKQLCDAMPPHDEASEVQVTAPIVTFFATRPARAELSKAQMKHVISRLHTGVEMCPNADRTPADLTPAEQLIEVSLNNDLVAKFLRNETKGVWTGKCDDNAVAVPVDSEAAKRAAKSEKEIAVRVSEAPLGWTLSAATTDWLTRYARKEACKLRAQSPVSAAGQRSRS